MFESRFLRRSLRIMSLVLVLLGAGAVPALAWDVSSPYVLTDPAPVAGNLPGKWSGSYDYYRIDYPGGDLELRIQVAFHGYDTTQANALGFVVYGLLRRHEVGDWKQREGYIEVTYQEEAPATLLVQLYNYTRFTFPYTVVASGLPSGVPSSAPVQPTPTPTPVAGSSASGTGAFVIGSSVSGTIVGNRAGAFASHTLQLVGDKKDVTVTMTFSPADPSFKGAFGFRVYDPTGKEEGVGPVSTKTLGELKMTFSPRLSGEYLVRVHNYANTVPMQYTLRATQ